MAGRRRRQLPWSPPAFFLAFPSRSTLLLDCRCPARMPPSVAPRPGDAARAAHVLEVTWDSVCKDVGAGRYVASAAFAAGGYDWAVRFYPDGDGAPGSSGYVSADLALVTGHARVRASFNLGLVDRATWLPAFDPVDAAAVFDTTTGAGPRTPSSHGRPRLMERHQLESSPAYLRDGTVAIACVVTVIGDTAPEAHALAAPDLPRHLGELLQSKEGADVVFDVDGEAFAAHSLVLAARSPVFEAELHSSSTDSDTHRIAVHGVRPAVFRALLHFIYTDSLPAMSGLGTDETRDMVQHLLVAADRYAMERLKATCEIVLARTLSAETVAGTLVLVDGHGCGELKDACVDFIASSREMDDGDEVKNIGEGR